MRGEGGVSFFQCPSPFPHLLPLLAIADMIGNEAATVVLVARNTRRLLVAVRSECNACVVLMFAVVFSCFLLENCKRYCRPPLAQEETQLKQSMQRDVSTVRFLLSIASALHVCSQFPQCVQVSLSKVMWKNE